MSAFVKARLDPSLLILSIERELTNFLDEHGALLTDVSEDLAMLADAARQAVLSGGKRLRPTFAFWGWRSVQPDGAPAEPSLIRAAASLELLQACALVHDDVLDSSDTRRGQPAVHIRFAQRHRDSGWPGSATSFGDAAAILLGDLLLSWSEEMFRAAIAGVGAERATAAGSHFDRMRTEVVAGQFLDVLAQSRGAFDPEEALRVVAFKTSKYTVERPLLLGAAAGGGSARLLGSLSAYGQAVGEAFQLRDDLLGVFGNPELTGKPAGDDLREGKRTLLVALAAEAADPVQRRLIEDGVGNPGLTADGVRRLREVLVDTGARERVERRIAERADAAAGAITSASDSANDSASHGGIRAEASRALLDLAQAAAHRSF